MTLPASTKRPGLGTVPPGHPVLVKVALILLCFFFPFVAVLLHGDPPRKVLIALVLQLLGHFPGVIYGLIQITRD